MNSLVGNINWNDTRAFKVWNYKYTKEDVGSTIIEALSILLGDYEIYRKQAALLLMKVFVRDQFLDFLLEDKSVYPYDRNDNRVRRWTEAVVSKGYCEMCKSQENLEAHHIIKWSDYPQGRIDVKNGMCLCHKCHTEQHISDRSYHMMKAKPG